jgi:gamma-glutamyltranspeptidase/glutathione hydrolase
MEQGDPRSGNQARAVSGDVYSKGSNAVTATPTPAPSPIPPTTPQVIPGLGMTIYGRSTQSRLEPGHPAEVKPGKRPRLTPNPSMAFKDGKLFMTFGTPGGDQQSQAMLQVFLNVVDHGMTVQQAVEAPRLSSS